MTVIRGSSSSGGVTVTTTIDLEPEAKLKAIVYRAGGEADRDLRNRARRVQYRAIQLAPKKTGTLARSIRLRVGPGGIGSPTAGDRTYQIVADTPYAMYVHQGTRPHLIYGRPYLAWSGPTGRVVINASRKPVRHPGTRPQPFLADALGAAGP